MRYPIVIDFETKHSFREKPNARDLGISVAGMYDYKTDSYHTFEEHELQRMFPYFEAASVIIGFNIVHFDLPVIQPYYPGDVSSFRVCDLLVEVKNSIGRRIKLDDLVKATLGEGKSGHGLEAIRLFRQGHLEELKKYCLDDVRLTKELFDYGVKNGRIFYPKDFQLQEKNTMYVHWRKHMEYNGGGDNVSLTLPFA